MGFRYRRKTLLAGLALAVVVAVPGIAQAGDSEETTEETTTTTLAPEPVVSPAVFTLLVPGSGLSVTINRGEGGVIESVGLDPAPGATIIKEKDHKVVFLLGDGDTVLVVKSREGRVQTKVKGDATADVTGPGSWSADVFGTGQVTIPYNVTFVGNVPTITIDPGAITFPAGVTVDVGEPTIKTSEDGHKSSYKIKVRLSTEDDQAKVSFKARTHVNDDGTLSVSLSVSYSEGHRNHKDDDRHRGDKDHYDGDDDRRGDSNDDRDGDQDGDREGDHDGDREGSDGEGGGGGDN